MKKVGINDPMIDFKEKKKKKLKLKDVFFIKKNIKPTKKSKKCKC
jgi:hypothetical protein